MNIATGELNRIESTDSEKETASILKEAKDKVDTLVADAPFERCFTDEPETFNKLATGNRRLGMECYGVNTGLVAGLNYKREDLYSLKPRVSQ